MNIPSSTPYPMGSGAAPYPSGPSPSTHPPPRPPPVSSQSTTGSIQADTIRASVLSAVEDKVRSKLRERMGTNSAEMASIRSTGEELREGQQKLKKMLEELEAQKTSCQTAVDLLSVSNFEKF